METNGEGDDSQYTLYEGAKTVLHLPEKVKKGENVAAAHVEECVTASSSRTRSVTRIEPPGALTNAADDFDAKWDHESNQSHADGTTL